MAPARTPDLLTPRQTEVLGLLAAGYTQPEIAAQLDISPRTVKTHVTALRDLLGVRVKAVTVGIVLEAMRRGLLYDRTEAQP